MTHLKIGDRAPKFSRPTDGNGTLSLGDLSGQVFVLYFYPKDDTSGCTKEACGFNENLRAFQKLNIPVIGVSKDSVKSHDKFKAKYALDFPLIADEDCSMASAYGVWVEKSMYGRTYMGVERSTFLIDAKGHIARIWPKVKIDGHVADVLAAVTELQDQEKQTA